MVKCHAKIFAGKVKASSEMWTIRNLNARWLVIIYLHTYTYIKICGHDNALTLQAHKK